MKEIPDWNALKDHLL